MDIPYGYIYLITNLVNGKTYVGQRKLSADKYWRQFLGSGALIKQAIVKYGESNFTKTLLDYAMSITDLDTLEASHISKLKAQGKCEYNISLGGTGGNTWAKSSELSRLEGNRKRSIYAQNRWEKFREKRNHELQGDLGIFIYDLFHEGNSVRQISKMLKLLPKTVKETLLQSGISLEELHNVATSRKALHDKFLLDEDLIKELYCNQNLPMEEVIKIVQPPYGSKKRIRYLCRSLAQGYRTKP